MDASHRSGGLLTVQEAAATLRLSRNRVYALVGSGAMLSFRVSDGPRARIRIPASEVSRFLAESVRDGDAA